MADEKQPSAMFKRQEQLKRWEESDTNSCLPHTDGKDTRVKFQDGCVFLAACSSGDRAEVKRLLDRGADINTANIDGLTALHQACIDDNLDMVEFLVEEVADVDVCDNEGWTPLHATASCGFTEIARYLLRTEANVAAVNNDGDLPVDICEDDEMEKLLQDAMDAQGVDADAARREEEDRMMADANQLLNGGILEDEKHPKTGATPLHVAAAKGYVKVINVLLQAKVDINARDNDNWTPLHAAAHWGQEESCKILAENMCDMEAKNPAGQTAFDVADTELIKLLEELKLKQASLKDQQKDQQREIIQTRVNTSKRRSSVTRMSVEQKHNMMKVEQEHVTGLDTTSKMEPTKEEEKTTKSSSSSSCSEEEETSESETEKKNEINKQTGQNQPRERDKPPVMTMVEIKEKSEMPKIDETSEAPDKENVQVKEGGDDVFKNESELIGDDLKKDKDEVIDDVQKRNEMIGDGLKKEKKEKVTINDKTEIQKEEEKELEKEKIIDDTKIRNKEILIENEDKKEKETNEENKSKSNKEPSKPDQNEDEEKKLIENVPPKKDREGLKRTASAPPTVTEVPKITINTKSLKLEEKGTTDIPSWRTGLRKTGSTSMVPHDSSVNKINKEDNSLPRSASSPRLAEDKTENKNNTSDKPAPRRPFLSSSSFSSADQNSTSSSDRSQGLTNPYRYAGLNSTSNYVPMYRRLELERVKKENARISLPVTSAASTVSTSSTTITTPTSSFPHYRKSYEPPKRDEETEMLRKVRAKRARETRRSTQGVTLEDVQQANEVLKKSDPVTTTTATTTTSTATLDRIRSGVVDSTDSVVPSASDNRLSANDVTLRRTASHNESDSSVSSWRRSRDIRDDGTKKEDDTRGSFRRSRVERDLSNSAPSSSFYSTDTSYVPRSQRADRSERNALSVADIGNSSLASSVNLSRSASLRSDRIRPTDDDSRVELRRERDRDRDKKIETPATDLDKTDREDKRPESTAVRSRRMRRERRSTGIPNYTAEAIQRIREAWAKCQNNNDEEEKDKENKEESKEERTETEEKSTGSRFNRYGSASDVPTHLSDKHSRPSSYTEYSRSTPSLEKDYKRLYEEEKLEKDRLKRDLEQCKRELKDSKVELDRQMKRQEASRVSDTNDKREKRALERKLSELEEEIRKMDQLKEDNKRLREENGALIRVISKLSK